MTKPRTPGTLPDAIVRIMAGIGTGAAAQAVGKSESLVRYWSDPDDDRYPSAPRALALDAAMKAATGETPIADWHRAALTLIDAPAHEPAEPLDRLGQLNKEFGEFAEALAMAGNGSLSGNLANHVLKELQDLIDHAEAARRDIQARTPEVAG